MVRRHAVHGGGRPLPVPVHPGQPRPGLHRAPGTRRQRPARRRRQCRRRDGSADYPLSLFDSYLDLDGGLESSRITSIEAPDDSTLVITTSEPLATLAQIFIPILPKHIWQDITFEDASVSPLSVEQSVGTGPFRMVQFEPEQAVILEARDDYWGGAPYIDELVYQFFDNDEAQVNALISGDVDYLNIFPPTLARTLLAARASRSTPPRAPTWASWASTAGRPRPERFIVEGCADCPKGPTTGSMGDPWLTRADVRAALAGLLDKRQLIEFAQSGYADPGVSVVSPLNPTFGYVPPAGDPVTFPAYTDEAGQAAARATAEQRFRDAMAAIGFTDTDGNGILNVPSDDASVAFDPEGAGADWSLRLHVRDSDTEDKLAAPAHRRLVRGRRRRRGVAGREHRRADRAGVPLRSPTRTSTCTCGAGVPTRTRTSS